MMLITKSLFTKDNVTSTIVKFLLEENQRNIELVIHTDFINSWFNIFNDNITYLMNHKQHVQYAVYAAKLVLHIFENIYPDDNKPRQAIEAAKKCIEDPSAKNIQNASHSTSFTNNYAYYVCFSAACSACFASTTAISHSSIAWSRSTVWSAIRASKFDKKIKNKIMKYGLELLME